MCIDDATYKILHASPEAIALETRGREYHSAPRGDARRMHRAFLDAALQFAEAVRQRSREHLHLWARPGELVTVIPWTADARRWIRAHGHDGKALMVRYWCEELTVRSPLDRRRRRTFGPFEATWARLETEADRVAYERRLREER